MRPLTLSFPQPPSNQNSQFEKVFPYSDQFCFVNSTYNVKECCWPYQGNAENVACPPRFEGPLALAASALYVGNERKIKIRITQKGFYLISCKALGYMGGNYILSTEITEVAVDGTDPNGEKVVLPPGHMSYGQTVGGYINHTAQYDDWKFTGAANDKVYIGMGPGFQPKTSGDLSRCGKPYGKGQTCLDSYLTLIAPSGKVEASNHLGFQNDFVGSMIGTFETQPNPYVSETEDGSFFQEKKSIPHVLRENGTYTIRAQGSAYFDDKNQRVQNGFSAYGEYFLQIVSVGKQTEPTLPHCPLLAQNASLGFDEPGCPNFVWGAHNGNPRLAERHKNCEKFYPIGPVVGGDTINEGTHHLRNWRLQKTGKYLLRVRSTINNCFREQIQQGSGASDFFCRPSAGAFDLKIKVRPGPTDGYPELPPRHIHYPENTYVSPLTTSQGGNVTVAEFGRAYGLGHRCGSSSPFLHADAVCCQEMVHGLDDCDASYKYLDTPNKSPVMDRSDVTRLQFNATEGKPPVHLSLQRRRKRD